MRPLREQVAKVYCLLQLRATVGWWAPSSKYHLAYLESSRPRRRWPHMTDWMSELLIQGQGEHRTPR